MVMRLIAIRVLLGLLTLFLVSVFIFASSEVLPGDIAERALGRFSSEEARLEFRQQLHLDLPVSQRYFIWLGGALRGDLGEFLITQIPVNTTVLPRFRNTLVLAGFSFMLFVPATLILSILAALNRGKWIDNLISVGILVGLSLPEFVVGTGLMLVFSVAIPLFPSLSLIQTAENFVRPIPRRLALPGITLAVVMTTYSSRMLRDGLIEVLDSDYVRMAILKGLPRLRAMIFHVLPNALAPTLNTVALNLVYLIGGVVVVENVFTYDGLGSLLVRSIFLRDAPIVEAVALLGSSVYILANLISDVAAILLNPRLRTS